MGAIKVRKLEPNDLRSFVNLPFSLYEKDSGWVAPLAGDQMKMLSGGSHFLSGTEHAFISLPAADSPDALGELLDSAETWAREKGLKGIVGPWSPTDTDDDKGLLVDGFDGPPSLMGSYNKPWYKDVFEAKGYGKLVDFLSYSLVKYPEADERALRVLDIAFKRTRTEVRTLNRSDLMRDFRDIHEIMLKAVGDNPDLPSPTWEQFLPEARRLAKMADENLILIARKKEDGTPVAFVAAMPNWSEVLKRIRGRLFPFGWIHAIGAKKKIKGVRVLMQFCIPEYHGSGILPILYYKLREKVVEGGYEYWEAGTIRDDNMPSRKPVEDVGGKLFRTYRWYRKYLA